MVRLLVIPFCARTVGEKECRRSSSERQQPAQNLLSPPTKTYIAAPNPSQKEPPNPLTTPNLKTVGPRPSRRSRLRPARRTALALAEHGPHGHRPDLDALVLRDQAAQPVPRLGQLPAVLRRRYPEHACAAVPGQPRAQLG